MVHASLLPKLPVLDNCLLAGLGLELVKELAAHGARVLFTSRNIDKGHKVIADLKSAGVKVYHPTYLLETWPETYNIMKILPWSDVTDSWLVSRSREGLAVIVRSTLYICIF